MDGQSQERRGPGFRPASKNHFLDELPEYFLEHALLLFGQLFLPATGFSRLDVAIVDKPFGAVAKLAMAGKNAFRTFATPVEA